MKYIFKCHTNVLFPFCMFNAEKLLVSFFIFWLILKWVNLTGKMQKLKGFTHFYKCIAPHKSYLKGFHAFGQFSYDHV